MAADGPSAFEATTIYSFPPATPPMPGVHPKGYNTNLVMRDLWDEERFMKMWLQNPAYLRNQLRAHLEHRHA